MIALGGMQMEVVFETVSLVWWGYGRILVASTKTPQCYYTPQDTELPIGTMLAPIKYKRDKHHIE